MVLLALALLGCKNDTGPEAFRKGQIYAGAAVVDMTPDPGETWDDLNGDHLFDGCLDDPDAKGADCDEPFNDKNGNGQFDTTWIGGFSPLRPAVDVHDPIEARAVVLYYNGEYIALVGLDLVGLSQLRIHAAQDLLAADAIDPMRVVVASTHNHQGPDTMGLWGDPEAGVTGMDYAYQERVTESIAQAVRDAFDALEPVTLEVGALNTTDFESQWLNGANWGGENPTFKQRGMVNDIRDPVVVSDQLLVMQGHGDDGTVFTWTNWSGHPETRGGDNNSLSSDYAGYLRGTLEDRHGGIAIHMPSELGGMQSALGGDVPLLDKDGAWVYSDQKNADGDRIPEWAEHSSWDFARSHGILLADATDVALADATTHDTLDMRVQWETLYFPVTNVSYFFLGELGIFDTKIEDAVKTPDICPDVVELGNATEGCLDTRTARIQLGPIGFVTAPGELLPELSRGFPDDAAWKKESTSWEARGTGATYFLQHDEDCDSESWAACENTAEIGDCNCLSVHAVPYELDEEDAAVPLLHHFGDEVQYTAVLGMADNYLSYIIPEPDFNHTVSLFTDDGDHYEDTVSPGFRFATRLQQAQERISERW